MGSQAVPPSRSCLRATPGQPGGSGRGLGSPLAHACCGLWEGHAALGSCGLGPWMAQHRPYRWAGDASAVSARTPAPSAVARMPAYQCELCDCFLTLAVSPPL